MKEKWIIVLAAAVLIICCVTPGYSITGAGNCRNPEACLQCHTQDALNGVDIGCDKGTWSPTGPMTLGRDASMQCLLKDGRILITGGGTPPAFEVTDTAEIFDPATRQFSRIAATMSGPRWSHTQTTLKDGKVLIAGGRNAESTDRPGSKVLETAELFDPQTNTFTPTGSMSIGRRNHAAVLLNDGRVLITGGGIGIPTGSTMALDTAELYDPATGKFKLLTSKLSVPRQFHDVVSMPDGTVLLIGGTPGPGLLNGNKSVDRFDPATEAFTQVGDMHAPRIYSVATLLRDGRVILSGSWDGKAIGKDAEIYDPTTNSFTEITGSPHAQTDQQGVRLLDGSVMCPVGINSKFRVMSSTYLYQPESNNFAFTGSVQFARKTVYPQQLRDGRPILIGGYEVGRHITIAEIFTPSVLSQAKGMQNVIDDLPDAAFVLKLKVLKRFLSQRVSLVNQLIAQEQYAKARAIMAQQVIPRIDGCFGGASWDDLIKDCEVQGTAYDPARLLLKTLDEITGKLKPPTATISADVVGTEIPLEVKFTASATDPDGTISLYLWDFGDGANSAEQNPIHTYTCPGDYTVSLTVVDNDGLLTQASTTVKVPYSQGTTVSFSCELLPYYRAMCIACHEGATASAGLDLNSYEGLMKGSVNGPVVVPSDPDNSKLIQVTNQPIMHPANKGSKPVDEQTQNKQRRWIKEGALNN